MHQC
jgi:hypothetical protein